MSRLQEMSTEALNRELDQIYEALANFPDETNFADNPIITDLSLHADEIERELDSREGDRNERGGTGGCGTPSLD